MLRETRGPVPGLCPKCWWPSLRRNWHRQAPARYGLRRDPLFKRIPASKRPRMRRPPPTQATLPPTPVGTLSVLRCAAEVRDLADLQSAALRLAEVLTAVVPMGSRPQPGKAPWPCGDPTQLALEVGKPRGVQPPPAPALCVVGGRGRISRGAVTANYSPPCTFTRWGAGPAFRIPLSFLEAE